jgi:tRNA nucleotidyltransferase/poly(A) polymerase
MAVPHVDPQLSRESATRIVRVLRDAGHVAYFAGGCVRDELLGLAPSDYDVATDATPDRISGLFRHTNQVGAAFGVVLVKLGPCVNEVATFRADGHYSDKRRPDSVRFSSAPEDARRRDFTVNALFLDPLDTSPVTPRSPRGGLVIDHVSGMVDLSARLLRAVGDPEQRLAEDHLRALRAVRLSAKLGFAIEPATARAIARHASELAGVSRERIGDEVRRMLAHPSRAQALRTLNELALDGATLGETSGARAEPKILARLSPDAPLHSALAAWALDRGLTLKNSAMDHAVDRWRRGLCLSNDETDAFRGTLRALDTLRTRWASGDRAQQKRAAAGAWFAPALDVLAIVQPETAREIARRVDELRATPSGLAPTPLVTGDDLISAGFKPGPGFKRALDAAYDAQLMDKVRTREEGLELIQRLGVS